MLTRWTCAALAFAGLLASQGTALARCNVPSFNFTFGEAGAASMNAGSGAPCNIKLRQGIGTDFKSVAIVSSPAHGAVRVQDNLNFAYRSRPGYRGTDTFVVAIRGSKFGDNKVTRLTVAVAVTPSEGAVNTAWPAVTRQASLQQPSRRGAARQGATPNALNAKCLQDAGAGRDPVTGQMQFYLNHPSRMDRYKLCLAGGDRTKANAITVPELSRVHPGDRGPTFRR